VSGRLAQERRLHLGGEGSGRLAESQDDGRRKLAFDVLRRYYAEKAAAR
jgi:hypothetical protein